MGVKLRRFKRRDKERKGSEKVEKRERKLLKKELEESAEGEEVLGDEES